MTEQTAETPSAPAPPPEPVHATYEDFKKVRLITARVVAAEAVEGADKLLRLTLDDGKRQDRTIVSGIRKSFAPEDMVGRTICIVDNLKPRKIFNIMSEGMILAANHPDGSIVLMAPSAELPPGAEIS
ncbi:MAG: hypothetical protein AMXMBFR33_57150 [Candidatus Xenobia bacterium]